MKQFLSDKPLLRRGVIILMLASVIFLLTVFAGNSRAVERYYSDGLYLVVCYVLHPIFNIFPFSIGDLLYIAVIVYLIYFIVTLIKHLFKKRFVRAGVLTLGLIIGVQVSILLFYLLWGLNYFRPSAAERLNLKAEPLTVVELQRVTSLLIDSANATRSRLSIADTTQSNDIIYSRAEEAVLRLSGSSVNYRTYWPGVKPSLLTPILNYISTSGYYNPFTTEAQINYQQPLFARPFVACHEMSHQMGFGAEDEANFAGFMAAIASKDKLLRYSAYHLAVGEFMITLRGADSVVHKQLKTRISPAVKADFKAEREYWLAYQNKAEVITGLFYDRFLKVNNQPQGLDTYNQMVTLVMALYRKK